MGTIVLQMMITVDGLAGGPDGEMDWISRDIELHQAHQTILDQSQAAILGIEACAGMAEFWTKTEHNEDAGSFFMEFAREFNDKRKIAYSHKEREINWRNTEVHIVKDDEAIKEDINLLKKEINGQMVFYGGIRLAQKLLKLRLIDEIYLDVCPVILGKGKPLFPELNQRTELELLQAAGYKTGAALLHYKVVNKT